MTEETAKKATELLAKKSQYLSSLSDLENPKNKIGISYLTQGSYWYHPQLVEFPEDSLKELINIAKGDIKKAIRKIDTELELLNC